MASSNQLSLFGFDLSVLYRRAVLGLEQLLWGSEAGLRERLCPGLDIRKLEELEPNYALGQDSQMGFQLLVPDSFVLLSEIELPPNSEIYLEAVVAGHVSSNSPFSMEETCWGYLVKDRSGQVIVAEVAILARRTISEMLSEAAAKTNLPDLPVDVLVASGAGYIPVVGYQNSGRRKRYYSTLKQYALRFAVVMAGLLFLVTLPAILMSQNAQQYADLLAETTERTREIVGVRGQLVEAQAAVLAANDFFSEYPLYRRWLHRIAELTPDSVYLNRMAMEGDEVTITGLAENAADYQALLTGSGLFLNVTAPSAFSLDSRAGRERFTLTMRLIPEVER